MLFTDSIILFKKMEGIRFLNGSVIPSINLVINDFMYPII